MKTLEEAMAAWRADYGELGTDGTNRWMTQLDHGSEQYEHVMDLGAAYDASLAASPSSEGEGTPG